MTPSLARWINRQYKISATAMMQSVSATNLVKTRPLFQQAIRPLSGAVVASPIVTLSGDAPDYFFHWNRDSALVIDAMRLIDDEVFDTRNHFVDFVHFNVSLGELDGRLLVADPSWRSLIDPAYAQFVRTGEDLAGAYGKSLGGETRFNADGTLDITCWGRPQNDGPPLRMLALLRWLPSFDCDNRLRSDVSELLRTDIEFTLAHWHEPCFDIWEEDLGLHYYTLRIQAAALDAAAGWLGGIQEHRLSTTCCKQSAAIFTRLDEFWSPEDGIYRSRFLVSKELSTKELDMSVILATIHAGGRGPTHSVLDERVHATLSRLDELFDADYAINKSRVGTRGPALGRYRGDVYISGGAWYLTTLGAAEFCFRAAGYCGDSSSKLRLIARGDGYLETVRAFTPVTGALSEQFDQTTGEQTSAEHLAWSYAAFLTCAEARRSAVIS